MKILLLAGNTLRAKAYAQALEHADIKNIEIKGLLYGELMDNHSNIDLNTETTKFFNNRNIYLPNYSESLIETFKNNKWNFITIKNKDVNSDEIIKEIRNFNCDIIVFAGYGGQLLKQQHFDSKNKYLHMHPGKLPLERGSTTLYYSILNKRKCTVTAFYMTAEIDNGSNILFKEYDVPNKGVDIDRWYDNVVRADCFVSSIKRILTNGKKTEEKQGESNEYYVIHPVLKHLAILSLNKSINAR